LGWWCGRGSLQDFGLGLGGECPGWLVIVWLGEYQDVGRDPVVWCSEPAPMGSGRLADGGGVSDAGVQGDDVLEVEQVGVLRAGHKRPGGVEKFARGPVTVGEHGEN